MTSDTSPRTLLERSLTASALGALLRPASVVLGVALTAAAAQFTSPLPFTAVPFVLTPLAVLLVGAALGARLGAIAQVSYILLGVLGLPVFTPSATLPQGWLRLIGPTGGYLLAYPLAAFVTGWLAERGWDRRYGTSFAAMVVGLAVIYLGGVSWLAAAFTHSVPTALTAGLLPFAALDVLKAAAAAMILPQAWRLLGRGTQE